MFFLVHTSRRLIVLHALMPGHSYAAFAFTSGMSALMTMTRLCQPGDEILIGSDIYGGMYRFLTKVAAMQGLVITAVETTDLAAVEAAIKPNTKMLHMETPSNPLMKITDVRGLSAVLKPRGILLSIDATMMSPYLMKPLALGADVVVHSATKFFGGHADAMGGFVVINDPQMVRAFEKKRGKRRDCEEPLSSIFPLFLMQRSPTL